MVPVCRHLRHMVQVYMVMVLAMVCLMLAGPILGFAEALALVEASVGAGVEVAAEADLVIGSIFNLALNCRKDRYYAKR